MTMFALTLVVAATRASQSAPAYASEAEAARHGVVAALTKGDVRDAIDQFGRLATVTNATDPELLSQIAIASLISTLTEDDLTLRIETCRVLLADSPHQCKDDLGALAATPNLPLVTRLAAAALDTSRPADRSSFGNLAREAGSRDQLAVANASRQLPAKESLPILKGLLDSPDADDGVRSEAVAVLAENEEPGALDIVRGFVQKNPGYEARADVMVALARLGDQEALQAMPDLLDSLDGPDLLAAGEALARSGDTRGLDALRRLVIGPQEMTRLDAAVALERQGDPLGRSVLGDALSDENLWIRLRALELINKLPLAPDRRVWELMAEDDPWVRFRAATATLSSCRRAIRSAVERPRIASPKQLW